MQIYHVVRGETIAKLLIAGCLSAAITGCGATARDVQTGATMASLGGAPGAGTIGLGAFVVDQLTKTRFQTSGGIKARLDDMAQKKQSAKYTRWLLKSRKRFEKGEWGDNDAAKAQNISDFESGNVVGVIYTRNDGEQVVFAYSKSAPEVKILTYAEWQEMRANISGIPTPKSAPISGTVPR